MANKESSKKVKLITSKQFHIMLVIVILIIFIVVYFSSVHDRFVVQEKDGFVMTPIISLNHPLTYKTEFCASKLTDLAHEIHFLEDEINTQEELIKDDGNILKEKETVMQIEQREITEIKTEFDIYVEMCDEFDETPTPELCSRFLNESKQKLIVTQENAENSKATDWFKYHIHDLRQAQRIYEGLQEKCSGVE